MLASYYSTAQSRVLILQLSIHIFDNLSMKATDNNLGTQIPDTQVRNQDDPKLIFLAPGSWLFWPDTALTVLVILEMNQQMEGLTLCLCHSTLPTPNTAALSN